MKQNGGTYSFQLGGLPVMIIYDNNIQQSLWVIWTYFHPIVLSDLLLINWASIDALKMLIIMPQSRMKFQYW